MLIPKKILYVFVAVYVVVVAVYVVVLVIVVLVLVLIYFGIRTTYFLVMEGLQTVPTVSILWVYLFTYTIPFSSRALC